MNTNFFFLKLTGASGISWQKFWDVPPNSLVSLGFEVHTELFGHPFTWKTPYPPEDIRTKRSGLGSFFLSEFGLGGLSLQRALAIHDSKVLVGLDCRLHLWALLLRDDEVKLIHSVHHTGDTTDGHAALAPQHFGKPRRF